MQPILKDLKKTLFYLVIPFSVVFSHIAAAPITPSRNLRTHRNPAVVTTTHGGTSLDDWSIVHQVPDETSDKKEEKLFIEHPKHLHQFHVENMRKHLNGEAIHPSTGQSALHTSWVMDKILGTTDN